MKKDIAGCLASMENCKNLLYQVGFQPLAHSIESEQIFVLTKNTSGINRRYPILMVEFKKYALIVTIVFEKRAKCSKRYSTIDMCDYNGIIDVLEDFKMFVPEYYAGLKRPDEKTTFIKTSNKVITQCVVFMQSQLNAIATDMKENTISTHHN